MTTHRGPYDFLNAAHQAIRTWRAANGRPIAGCRWEIYGDWHDDPTKLQTDVCYHLK